MKKNSLIIFLSLTLSLVGCASSNSSSASKKKDSSEKQTTLKVNSSYIDLNISSESELSLKEYSFKFTYKDSLFSKSATTFSKDLALLSYGLGVANQDKETMSKFYSDLAFSNVEYAEEYDEGPKVSGVGYTFAIKETSKYNLVAVSIRGFNYTVQWLDNFQLGDEGDHLGFAEKADAVHLELKDYISKIDNNKPVKLWMAGYSRGGAIINVLANRVMSSPLTSISNENIYVYTFESPRALSEEHAIAYDNVFNIINSADLVTKLAPEQYGLYRCGKDIEIYSKDFDKNIKAYDKDAVIPAYQSSLLYKDDAGLADYLLKCLLSEDEVEEGERNWSASTRELYNENYGEDIRYLIAIISATEGVSMEDIMNAYTNMDITQLLTLIGSSAGFLTFVEETLDGLNIEYEEVDLEKAVEDLYHYFSQSAVLRALTALASKDTIVRLLDMHMPDTTYMLLNALKIL